MQELKLVNKYAEKFLSENAIREAAPKGVEALKTLHSKSGAGNDFLGWLTLPTDYDKEEFARIKKAAEYIKKNSDILVVIGIGGSYLGARAVIEALKSPNYNALAKDTPQIYFIGNTISPSMLNELLEICEDKDICVNVISKSGTTTEPAIAFRIFRELVYKKYSQRKPQSAFSAQPIRQRALLKALPMKRVTKASSFLMRWAADILFSPLSACSPLLVQALILTHL